MKLPRFQILQKLYIYLHGRFDHLILSKLIQEIAVSDVQKIQILTPNIGVVYSGMGSYSRVLVRKSRKQAEQYNLLYKVDPSGPYFSWKVSAMGKNVSNAKTFLKKRYTDDMELEDAIHTAILTLKEGFLTAAQIEDYLQEVE